MHPTLKKAARRVLEALDPIGRWKYRATSGLNRPIPPMRMRTRTAARWAGKFVESGRRCADALESALKQTTGKRIDDFDSVLDFGCGCGRTIMQWDLSALKRMVGCDVDAPAIDWLRGAYPNSKYPNLSFEETRFDPPLPFADGTFDLIYSVSIFSHLSGADAQMWLKELARVTRPGGVALVTVQGRVALKRFHEAPDGGSWRQRISNEDLARDGFIFVAIPPQPGADPAPGIESPVRKVEYGYTFMTRGHIDSVWNQPPWAVLGVFEGTVDGLQDVVVLRKNIP
jgi:SAM-dependent methyltransferase